MLIKTNTDSKKFQAITLLGICLLTVCAFLPTFWNGFQMEWDDHWMVMNPQTVFYLNMESIAKIFCTPYHGQWAPFNQLLYTTLYNIFGYNPRPFHIASLLIHVANVCLVFKVLCQILTDCTKYSPNRIFSISFITSILFAIHPLQVEAVAWISASKILVSSTFYLLGTYTFIRFLNNNSKWSLYLFTLFLYTCSYLSKENVMTFPLWATVLTFMYGKQIREKFFWKANLPIYALTLLMSLHFIFRVSGYNNYIQGNIFPWWKRIALCFYSLFNYLYYWIMPIKLHWMYPYPFGLRQALPLWVLLYPTLIAIVIYAMWKQIKRRIIAYALLYVLIHLTFVIHLTVLPREAVIADRYMYLPIIGINVIFTYILTGWTWTIKHKQAAATISATLLALLVILTFNRVSDWHDSQTLKSEKSYDTNKQISQPLTQAVIIN